MIFDRCYIISYRSPKWSDAEWNKRHSKNKFQILYSKFVKKYNPYQKISDSKKTQETLGDFYE